MEDNQQKDDSLLGSHNAPSRILIIEDDESLANIYTIRMQGEGFEVRRVASGEEALPAALEFQPDLVISDVMMPKVDGLNVLETLRNTPETSHLRVIVLSALDEGTYQQRARELGVDRYLVKTKVTLEDIVNTAKDLIQSTQKV